MISLTMQLILTSLLSLLVAGEGMPETAAPALEFRDETLPTVFPPLRSGSSRPDYAHMDFGTLIKRYLRSKLALDDGFETGSHKLFQNDGFLAPMDMRDMRGTSYFDKPDVEIDNLEEDGPDFWDIVAWLGTQFGKAVRHLFNGFIKLCQAIYAGIVYGWHAAESEAPVSVSNIITPSNEHY
eukprot:Blabericola_migrator_1__4644@NODE_245_length_10909_cov_149_723298_g207_i0_p5_GENE_NODE_245_length_10909_cov_149_723298_g207_i0NODE_245_length_10909_cov_149_723298_g207_i0_p5_ORF_typecomplete_len182_score26_53Nic96/PF04097_14/9_4e02Nic96/PF04097_14/0_45_NODE_245_length_10909_cov_149_723298_g207_i01019610741